jgi:hypothetical protein
MLINPLGQSEYSKFLSKPSSVNVEISNIPTEEFTFDISKLSGINQKGFIKPSDIKDFWSNHLNLL